MHIHAKTFLLPGSFTLFLFFVCFMAKGYAQTMRERSQFQIFGRITGKDTGKVVIWYKNPANEGIADTAILHDGQFSFYGNASAAGESLIWTDIQNRDFDDQSVIRFILEPGVIHISKSAGIRKATITGSPAQVEKDKWDSVNSSLLETKQRCLLTLDSLHKLAQQTGRSFKDQIDSVWREKDSLIAVHTRLDMGYIAKYPDSYLSGYLLSKQYKRIPVDSVKLLYTLLADSVKNSAIGEEVLSYVYPLTNDETFRIKYPLVDQKFNKQLASIRSMHDFRLKDMSGKMADFATFQGKYLLIDVWASWCKPCAENIPAWNDLLKQYDPKTIQFVSVSLDREADAWKKSVAWHNPGGLHLIEEAAFKSLFAVYCKVMAVPTYIIADPAGRIVHYNAPFPGSPALRSLLDNLVKKGQNIK